MFYSSGQEPTNKTSIDIIQSSIVFFYNITTESIPSDVKTIQCHLDLIIQTLAEIKAFDFNQLNPLLSDLNLLATTLEKVFSQFEDCYKGKLDRIANNHMSLLRQIISTLVNLGKKSHAAQDLEIEITNSSFDSDAPTEPTSLESFGSLSPHSTL